MTIPSLQVSASGFNGGRAGLELRHAAKAGGQHRAAEALPSAVTTTQGCEAQREPGETLREPPRGCQDQAGGTGTDERDAVGEMETWFHRYSDGASILCFSRRILHI